MKINKNFLLTITAAVLLFTGCKPESHEHTFSNEWRYDGEYHWREATCEHYSLTTDKEEHQWNEGIVTKDATEDSEGIRTYTCLVCGLEGTEEIARLKHKHSFKESWTINKENHDEHIHHIDDCSCGLKGSTSETGIPAPHNWKTDCDSIGVKICADCSYYSYEPSDSDFCEISSAHINGVGSWTPESQVFISGRSFTIPHLVVCNHEVTNGEYKAVMNPLKLSENSLSDRDNFPVNKISWFDAIIYCNTLSLMENLTPCYTINDSTNPQDWENCAQEILDQVECDFTASGYRLPTEAEWEYLARAGDSYTYSGSNTASEVAWYSDDSLVNKSIHRVRTKEPNTFMLYDMSGNLWEWCWDWSGNITESTPITGVESGDKRVRRGGYYQSSANMCSVSYRSELEPYSNLESCGFRVVRSEVN